MVEPKLTFFDLVDGSTSVLSVSFSLLLQLLKRPFKTSSSQAVGKIIRESLKASVPRCQEFRHTDSQLEKEQDLLHFSFDNTWARLGEFS